MNAQDKHIAAARLQASALASAEWAAREASAPPSLVYDYSAAQRYAAHLGLPWVASWVAPVDAAFALAGLTQAQVDAVLWQHAWHVKHLFTPASYSWRQRLALAAHFLFSRKG